MDITPQTIKLMRGQQELRTVAILYRDGLYLRDAEFMCVANDGTKWLVWDIGANDNSNYSQKFRRITE